MSSIESEEPVLAYRTTDAVEARSLAAELEDAGIEVQFVGDFRDAAYSGLFVGSLADKELWISERDRPVAEGIVAEWRRTYHPKDLEPEGPFQFSLRSAFILMTLAFLACVVMFGPRPLGIAISLLPYLLFVYYAVHRLMRRRHDGDDESVAGELIDKRA